jgi:Domain of unknown function (DUF4338)
MPKVLPILTLESRIKRDLRKHLKSLGFIRDGQGGLRAPDANKDSLRALHRMQRQEKLQSHTEFILSAWVSLGHLFADGKEINPSKLVPRIERVFSNTWQSDLFRLATLTWSVPVSAGYGRRLRFLVWDEYNGKLIGIFALGDPVFNLRARDEHIGWDSEDRKERLVNMLDAYVLGAVQPYSMLLGGKLLSCLTNSLEVQKEFQKAYGASVGIISSKKKKARLALITTTSSLGRSSIYNRLSLGGRSYFKSIGYTEGWGHFHVPTNLFDEMRNFLEIREHPYASNHSYGDGPNWKLRTVKAALSLAGINPDVIKHGVAREVFISALADNSLEVMLGKHKRLRGLFQLSAAEIGEQARDRWIVPRAKRNSEYINWDRNQILSLIYDERKDVLRSKLPSS